MAITGQDLSNFDAALKYDYLPAIRKQLDNSTILLNRIQKNSEDVTGKRWQMVAHYQRNAGIGARADGGVLPDAGKQSYVNPYGTVKYNYGRIEVTGPTMAASRNDKGAVVRALDSEIKGVTNDVKKDINYQLFNDGTSKRAIVNGDPGTGTTLTVDSPGTHYMYEGMLLDVRGSDSGDGDNATNDATVVISSVDSTTEVTVSAALEAAIDDNDYIVALGSAGTTNNSGVALPSDSYEMMGLKGIVDDNTYVDTLHGLSRTTYGWWDCSTHSTDDNSGTDRDLTLDLIQASITAVLKNGGNTNLIITTYDLLDAYAALLVADRRFTGTLDLDGGFKGLEYSGINMVADPDATPNTMYFLDTNHLFLMQMGDWDWMDKDGSILSRVSGYDAYEAVLTKYMDLATDKPRAHSFLRDVE